MSLFRSEALRAAQVKHARLDRAGPRVLPSGAVMAVAGSFLLLAIASASFKIERSSRQTAQLEYVRGSSVIRAPIDGQVGKVFADVGTEVSPGDEVVAVVASRRVRDMAPETAFAEGRIQLEQSYKTIESKIREQHSRRANRLNAEIKATSLEIELLQSELSATADSLRATEAIANDYSRMAEAQLLPRIEAHRIQNELAGKRANQDQIKRQLVAKSAQADALREELRMVTAEQDLELERLAVQKRGELGALYGDEAGYLGSMLAPAAAIVEAVYVGEGEAVSRNDALVHLLSTDAVLGFRANVEIGSAAWTSVGDEVPIRIYSDNRGESLKAIARVESKAAVSEPGPANDGRSEPLRFEFVFLLQKVESADFVPSPGMRVEAEMQQGRESFLHKLISPFVEGSASK